MRILFITDNFPPEVNAPATRTFEHCQEWVKMGAKVTVITCCPNFPQGKVYPGYKNKLYQRTTVSGINVIRVWSYISPNKGKIRRTLDFFSFSISSFIVGLFASTDLIVATSPQFLSALSGRWLAFFKRKPWVMEVRDLWPASLITVGAMNEGGTLKFLRWIELGLYTSANKIVVVTDSFKQEIFYRGISKSKIAVVKNGANLELYSNQPTDEQLKKDLGLENFFVLGYIGTHGMAHKLDFILDCAKELNDSDYKFLFVGDGAEKQSLLEKARTLNLKNVIFLDPVVKTDVWRYISILDVMIVPLKKENIFKTVIPSKIFETAAMGKPILLGVDGEAREIIESYNAGLFFEPQNQTEFIRAVELLKADTELYQNLQKGCEKLASDFERKKMASLMLNYLKETTL